MGIDSACSGHSRSVGADMKIFVLVVMSHIYGGGTVSFQEFTSLKQCQYAASLLRKEGGGFNGDVSNAFCVEK